MKTFSILLLLIFNSITKSNSFGNQDCNTYTPVSLEVILVPCDLSNWDSFGRSVFLSGHRAFIGSYSDDGSVYVFEFNGTSWILAEKLNLSDIDSNVSLGKSISVLGNRALIGAYHSEDNVHTGRVYVFEYDGSNWVQKQQLTPIDSYPNGSFGNAVSLSENYALIGDYQANETGLHSGAAYLYEYDGNTWVEVKKLKPSDGIAHNRFGYSVSLNGDHAVVTATYGSGPTLRDGAAYVFSKNSNWEQVQKIVPDNLRTGDRFGWSSFMSDRWLMVGADGDEDIDHDSGAVYVYKYDDINSNWVEIQKLIASDGGRDYEFGNDISISGDKALIGSYNARNIGVVTGSTASAGSAYLFVYDDANSTWTENQKLTPTDAGGYYYFGRSVSLDGDFALIGSEANETNGLNSGAAYIYTTDHIFINGFE